jgi:hypothetical protein
MGSILKFLGGGTILEPNGWPLGIKSDLLLSVIIMAFISSPLRFIISQFIIISDFRLSKVFIHSIITDGSHSIISIS